jgi:hypothetical protein
MKSKAKPAKGSSRVKKFDRGGTIGALAGLGTLAYLMRDKFGKKDEKSEGPQMSTAPKEESTSTSTPKTADDRKQDIFKSRPEYFGGNLSKNSETGKLEEKPGGGGNVGTRIDSSKPNSAASRTAEELKSNILGEPDKSKTYKAEPGEGYAKPVKPIKTESKPKPRLTPKKQVDTSTDKGFGKATQLSPDSDAAKSMRESRAQRLGSKYSSMYSALQSAPEGPGKEALKTAVANAKKDYEDAASGMKKGGKVKPAAKYMSFTEKGKPAGMKSVQKYAAGGAIKASKMGSVKTSKPSMGSASRRADGIAQRGKTKGRMV